MRRPLVFVAFSVLSSFSCHRVLLSNTQLGNWVQAAPIGLYPRSNAASFVIGDNAYVGLGYSEKADLQRPTDFWVFNVNTGWTQLEDFPGPGRSGSSAFSIGNYGYVGLGTDIVNVYSDFYQYDPGAHHWTKKANYTGTPRYDAVGFSLQGKGYMGTGVNKYTMNDFWQYDPDQDAWSPTPGTSGNFSKRSGAVAFVYKDKAYIVTGSSNGVAVRDFWSFDPSQAKPWNQLANITNTDPGTWDDGYTDIQRDHATAFVNEDMAFLATGTNGTMVTTTWAYDIGHDRWDRRTAYPRSARSGAVSFTISGLSFLGTGNSGSNSTFDDFDQFLPKVPFNPNDY
jgi:N-acetylneuraminic acid mutarotase